jgi:hypothetical protein
MNGRTYSEGETDRASLPKSSRGRSLGPLAIPRLAPPLPPLSREGHTLPIHHRLPEPNLPLSAHPLSPPILTYRGRPPPIQGHPHIEIPSHDRYSTLTKEQVSEIKTKGGRRTYCMDQAAESTPSAHSGDEHCTSWHDGRTPHMQSNDPARNAGQRRQGKGVGNN